MLPLKRAMGTLSAHEFESALKYFQSTHRKLKESNVAVARDFLVAPGRLQIVIAEEHSMSRQLVHKQCIRIYQAYREMKEICESFNID